MPEPRWLDRHLVDALHEQSLRLHGGLAGVRDASVLEAAIASPRNLWAYEGEDCLGANGIALSIGAGELVPQTIRAARS